MFACSQKFMISHAEIWASIIYISYRYLKLSTLQIAYYSL